MLVVGQAVKKLLTANQSWCELAISERSIEVKFLRAQ